MTFDISGFNQEVLIANDPSEFEKWTCKKVIAREYRTL